MMLDGVKPEPDTFRSLIVGTMRGLQLQDAFFFRDQMRSMGLVPDVALYNLLISICAKCKNSDGASRIFEEMKNLGVKPTGQTFICLLNAYAATGRVDRVYAIVRDMTAAGLGLNKFCYAGLIAAHKNKGPLASDTAAKILELVEQSKGWSDLEGAKDSAENVMMGVSEEELYNIPTAEYVTRRGFLARWLTVYHVAYHACADLRNVEAIDALEEMLKRDGKFPDAFLVMQIIRCYLHSGDIDRGLKVFEEYSTAGKPAFAEIFCTLVEGAMIGYTPKGMKLAQETLENMISKGLYLNKKMGTDLLLAASGEKTGGFTVANLIWDMLMQSGKVIPSFPAVQAYYYGLKGRQIPEDDPRLLLVSSTLDNLRNRQVS